jgi:hypothetical protein
MDYLFLRAARIGLIARVGGGLEAPTHGRIESSPESDGSGATTMLRQMVRNGAREGIGIAQGGRHARCNLYGGDALSSVGQAFSPARI